MTMDTFMAAKTTSAATSNGSAAPAGADPEPEIQSNAPTELAAAPIASQASSTSDVDEDAITQAVQVLSNLATLKLKVQESREQALQIRAQIDVLFSDELVSEEVINQLKDGFKVLKSFAQVNVRFREARAQAEQARTTLDRALQPGGRK